MTSSSGDIPRRYSPTWMWAALAVYAALYAILLLIRNPAALDAAMPIPPLLAFLACRFYSRFRPEQGKYRRLLEAAFLFHLAGDLFAVAGASFFAPGDAGSFAFTAVKLLIYLFPRLCFLLYLIGYARKFMSGHTRMELLWDWITILECVVGTVWFIYLQDNPFRISGLDVKASIALVYTVLSLSILSLILLISLYADKKSRTTGFVLLLLGVGMSTCTDLVQTLHFRVFTGSLVDIIYKAGTLLMAAGILAYHWPMRQPSSGSRWSWLMLGDRSLKAGILFVAYPLLVLFMKGVSTNVLLYFSIVIMSYFLVRLYAKQIRVTKMLLDSERQYTESLQLYLNVIEQSPLSILITDTDGNIEYTNPFFSKVTGYPKEQALGKNPRILRTGKTPADVYEDMWETILKGDIWKGEFVNRKKGGEEYEEAVIISPIKNAQDKITHFVGIKEDISEYKRIRKELSNQLYFINQLIDTLPNPLFYVDRDERFVGCNRAYEDAFRINRSQLRGLKLREFAHVSAKSYEEFSCARQQVQDTGRPVSILMKRIFADRLERDILYTVSTYRLSDGSTGGYLGIMTDISDLKQKEKELLNTNHFLDTIIDSLPLMLYVKNADTLSFDKVNRACGDFFGLSPLAMNGLTNLDIFPVNVAKALDETDTRVLRGGKPVSEIEVVQTPGKSSRYIHTTKLPMVDAYGNQSYLLGISEDITDLKQKEKQLEEALRLAEEATQAKSQFLANMSHEIRTPMNAIIGLAYLALRTELTGKQKDYVSKIHNAGKSLLGVLNDVLDISKIESGKLQMEQVDFVLEDVIGQTIGLVSQQAHDKGLELLSRLGPGIPRNLKGDPLRLGQILMNLLSNAVKFTREGQVEIQIERVSGHRNKLELQFSVSDTGIGMSAEAKARMFQAFMQADNSTTRKYGGTGLGLAISKELVEMMDGSIWVESVEGEGSVFSFKAWFEIPESAHTHSRIVPERLDGLRVLVVDDNYTAREILSEYLGQMRCRVETAESGEEALRAVAGADQNQPFDLILLDWKMEGICGLETSTQIRNDPSIRHQPAIILVTAFGEDSLKKQAEEAMVNDYLVKPVSESMLFDALVRIFSPPAALPEGREAQPAGADMEGYVLLVEDHEINQQIAVELLTSRGLRVDIAGNGAIAVEKMKNQASSADPYHLILMDLQMPEMDGFEAAYRIRAMGHTLPIIAMTARTLPEEQEMCLAAGMNDHVAKPIDPDNLFAAIRRIALTALPEVAVAAGNNHPGDPAAAGPEGQQGQWPPSIHGIDLEDGLRRVGHNAELYRRLLLSFADNQADTAVPVRYALRQGDLETVQRLVHNLKGVTANLGIWVVSGLCDRIERKLPQDGEEQDINREAEELEQLLRRVAWEIKERIPADPDAKAEVKFRAEPTVQALQKLLGMLQDSDSEAVDYYEAIKHELATLLLPDEESHLGHYLKSYELEEAATVIEAVLARHPAMKERSHDCR